MKLVNFVMHNIFVTKGRIQRACLWNEGSTLMKGYLSIILSNNCRTRTYVFHEITRTHTSIFGGQRLEETCITKFPNCWCAKKVLQNLFGAMWESSQMNNGKD